MKRQTLLIVAAGLPLLSLAPRANAQFTISGSTSSAQTIGSGTGTVTSTGFIRTTSSAVGVTFNGSSGKLVNSGTVYQAGTGRAVRITSTSGTFEIQNNTGALIRSTGEDAIQSSSSSPGITVTLTNAGTIEGNGGRAVDFKNVTTGSNTVINSGLILGNADDAVRPGANGVITNTGTIQARPSLSGSTYSGSDGIDGQTNTGINISNSGLITGRHGITGGNGVNAFTISVTNQLGGVISAVNGSSVNIDGSGSHLNLTNYGTMTGTYDTALAPLTGDGDGVDVDGTINLQNYGIIRGLGGKGNGADGDANTVEGLAAGGGTIVNHAGAEISGRATVGTTTVANGILIDNSSNGPAFAATNITNAGLIRGYSGFGIKLVGDWNNRIENQAGGTIQATGALVIETGSGNDTLINSGAIIGEQGALAIDLGAGNNQLSISGSAASVVGNISGGVGGTNTLTITPGSGNTFSYEGSISNFATVIVQSGTVSLAGASLYTGTTTIQNGASLIASNSTGSATGSGDVKVESGGTLAGSGFVAGNVLIQSGGILSAGTGDNLAIGGDLMLENGARFTFTLGNAAFDPIHIAGSLLVDGKATLDLVGAGFTVGNYTLLQFEDGASIDLSNFAFGVTPEGFIGNFSLTETALSIHIDAVPEPSSILLGIIGTGAAAWSAIRRRLSV